MLIEHRRLQVFDERFTHIQQTGAPRAPQEFAPRCHQQIALEACHIQRHLPGRLGDGRLAVALTEAVPAGQSAVIFKAVRM